MQLSACIVKGGNKELHARAGINLQDVKITTCLIWDNGKGGKGNARLWRNHPEKHLGTLFITFRQNEPYKVWFKNTTLSNILYILYCCCLGVGKPLGFSPYEGAYLGGPACSDLKVNLEKLPLLSSTIPELHHTKYRIWTL